MALKVIKGLYANSRKHLQMHNPSEINELGDPIEEP